MSFVSTEKFLSFCKSLAKKFNKHTTQLGGLYFGKNSNGKWGYKTSEDGEITPFKYLGIDDVVLSASMKDDYISVTKTFDGDTINYQLMHLTCNDVSKDIASVTALTDTYSTVEELGNAMKFVEV